MPDLGNRYDCYNCGAKFYDLGRPEPLCPKCGANQKDAKRPEAAAETSAARRRKKDEIARVAPEDEGEDLVVADAGDFGDEELVAPEGADDEEEVDVDDDD